MADNGKMFYLEQFTFNNKCLPCILFCIYSVVLLFSSLLVCVFFYRSLSSETKIVIDSYVRFINGKNNHPNST